MVLSIYLSCEAFCFGLPPAAPRVRGPSRGLRGSGKLPTVPHEPACVATLPIAWGWRACSASAPPKRARFWRTLSLGSSSRHALRAGCPARTATYHLICHARGGRLLKRLTRAGLGARATALALVMMVDHQLITDGGVRPRPRLLPPLPCVLRAPLRTRPTRGTSRARRRGRWPTGTGRVLGGSPARLWNTEAPRWQQAQRARARARAGGASSALAAVARRLFQLLGQCVAAAAAPSRSAQRAAPQRRIFAACALASAVRCARACAWPWRPR